MDTLKNNKNILRLIFLGLFFLALSTFYIAWVYSFELSDFGGDSAGYLLAAKVYAPFHAPAAWLSAYKAQIVYPPLFPWILAAFDGGNNILFAHFVVAGFGVAGLAVF